MEFVLPDNRMTIFPLTPKLGDIIGDPLKVIDQATCGISSQKTEISPETEEE